MPEILSVDARAIVEAVQDLTRLTIALHGDFVSKSEAIRQLTELSIPPARIAAILAIPVGDVSSALAKQKKRQADAVTEETTVKAASGRRSAKRTATTNGARGSEGERADA